MSPTFKGAALYFLTKYLEVLFSRQNLGCMDSPWFCLTTGVPFLPYAILFVLLVDFIETV